MLELCYNTFRGEKMIRIDTDQLYELIHKDKKIKKELEVYLQEDQKKLESCYETYKKKQELFFQIQEKRKKLAKQIEEQQNVEDKFHFQISHLEVQKIFQERKLRKLKKRIVGCKTEEEKEKLLLEYYRVEENIVKLSSQQEDIRTEIEENRSITSKLEQKQKRLHEQELDAEKETERLRENVSEWQISIETKTNLFYQDTFETMMVYYEPLRDLLVRNLQDDKALTKDEAKEKTNLIIIEPDEEILVDPPGYAKRLNKEKKEFYRHVEKM